MITSVIIVTHGYSGAEMVRAAEQKVGHAIDHLAAVGVAVDDPPQVVRERLDEAVRVLGAEDVVFLVDLGGSTPFNLCCRQCRGNSAVVSGVNMPMLFKLETADREHGARQLADELAASGAKSISVRDGAPEAT
jgi:mannose/fructose-specific phosphotransferase system component IIA